MSTGTQEENAASHSLTPPNDMHGCAGSCRRQLVLRTPRLIRALRLTTRGSLRHHQGRQANGSPPAIRGLLASATGLGCLARPAMPRLFHAVGQQQVRMLTQELASHGPPTHPISPKAKATSTYTAACLSSVLHSPSDPHPHPFPAPAACILAAHTRTGHRAHERPAALIALLTDPRLRSL